MPYTRCDLRRSNRCDLGRRTRRYPGRNCRRVTPDNIAPTSNNDAPAHVEDAPNVVHTPAPGNDGATPGRYAPTASRDGDPETSEYVDAPMTLNRDDASNSGDDATSIPDDAVPATPGEESPVTQGFRTLAIPGDVAPLPAVIVTFKRI